MRLEMHSVLCDGCTASTLGYSDAKQADNAALRSGWLKQTRGFDEKTAKHWCPSCRKAIESPVEPEEARK